MLEPIQKLKKTMSKTSNLVLSAEEILIALSICAATNPTAQQALSKLDEMRNLKAHSTTIMNNYDEKFYFGLDISITSDPKFNNKNLFYN